jgi:hypothetical protein
VPWRRNGKALIDDQSAFPHPYYTPTQIMTEAHNSMDHFQESRSCKECGVTYTIGQFYASCSSNFDPPDRYSDGCDDYCLASWLGVGPNDFPPIEEGDSEGPELTYPHTNGHGHASGRG